MDMRQKYKTKFSFSRGSDYDINKNKVEVIKHVRKMTGLSLSRAKRITETWMEGKDPIVILSLEHLGFFHVQDYERTLNQPFTLYIDIIGVYEEEDLIVGY